MKRAISLSAIALLLWSAVVPAGEEALLHLDPLLQEAIEKNPRILAAREKHAALRERIAQAGALDDPMVGFGIVSLPNNFDFNAEDMTMKEISLSQKLPFPGKRGLGREMAAKEADAAAAEVEEVANQVTREVKTAFYDLSHAYRGMEVALRNKSILEELTRIAQARYALGEGLQEEIIGLQVEISKMVDDLIMLDQKKRALAARINYLLDRPPHLPVGRPADFDFSRVAVSIEAIQQQALAGNPALKAMGQEIAARGKNVELAKQEVRPDFNLKLAYGERQDRRDMLSGMIEMNLPIFIASKQERKVAQTHAELRAARAGYENSQNEILYMTADMGSMVQRLEQKIALYRTGIIPQARLQIDTTMSAYMVDKADFMTLLDSRMRLYRYELAYHDALTEYEKSVAALEALIGSKLPREVPQ